MHSWYSPSYVTENHGNMSSSEKFSQMYTWSACVIPVFFGGDFFLFTVFEFRRHWIHYSVQHTQQDWFMVKILRNSCGKLSREFTKYINHLVKFCISRINWISWPLQPCIYMLRLKEPRRFLCILLREQRTAVKLIGLPKTMDSKY